MTLRLAVFAVFVLQVYVQVNKEAEHNEDMKQAARAFFRQLEQHESEAVSLWRQFREITVDEYQQVYKVKPAGPHNSDRQMTSRSNTQTLKPELVRKENISRLNKIECRN